MEWYPSKKRLIFFVARLLSVAFSVLIFSGPAFAAEPDFTAMLTSDTEGHTLACRTCPLHAGQGGLERRATLLNSLRTNGSA